MTSSILDTALGYIERGWGVIPVSKRKKKPVIKDWPNLQITKENVGQYFNGHDQNIGVRFGPVSGGLTDIDLDCLEAVRMAENFLPSTPAVFGRKSKPRSHYLYVIGDPDNRAAMQLKDGNNSIVELRMGGGGKGAQSVFPGSVHESGEAVEWASEGDPAPSTYAKLKTAVTNLAVAVILVRSWPAEGGRHEAALAIGGFLARAGWTAEAIRSFVEVVATHGGSDDPAARAKDAADSATAHAAGSNVYGLTRLKEIFGDAAGEKVAKLLGQSHSHAAIAVSVTSGHWRELMPNGTPRPTLHNARVAIARLGVRCSFDVFHGKTLFGFSDDTVRHVLESMFSENTDHGLVSLRQIISDRFNFDPGSLTLYDAVMAAAMENRFDPVLDMLAEAEAAWDRVERLDAMVVNYFNAEDTKLNRAMVRVTMIGAVRRVRRPGVKFDTILTLESPEGQNKSTALRVLAGDENFSDATILGKDAREVQEQLAGVWIHENSELAGMRKAEIEAVKAFASRQEDIARPAYGRNAVRQKRRSIEVATTNSHEYLLSQTGNRRFLPLRVNATIDIEKLRRDRIQLWGEAATYESRGESITLDESLWGAAGEAQELRRVSDPWEEILSDIPESVDFYGKVVFEEKDVTGTFLKVSTKALLKNVLNIPEGQQIQSYGKRLADVMKRLGWERPPNGNKLTIDGKQTRGFFRRKEGEQVDKASAAIRKFYAIFIGGEKPANPG